MLKQNLPTRLLIPQPFASKTGAAFTAIADGSDSTEGTVVNFKDGFPSVYAAPASGNGKYLGRGDMNALGDLASRNQFLRMCGSIVTFDADFATKIGGYPAGAVLKFLDGNYLYDVVSLVDNNLIDFTSVGVDGVNWKKLNTPYASEETITLFDDSIGAIDPDIITNISVLSCKLPRSGAVSMTVSFKDITAEGGSTVPSFVGHLWYKTDSSQTEYTKHLMISGSNQEATLSDPVSLPAGTLILVEFGCGHITSSDVHIKVQLT